MSQSAGDHCAGLLLRLVDELGAHAAEFGDGHGVEPLHRLRIGTRRLRAVLSFCRPLFHGEEDLVRAQRKLRALARPFGELRDVDVLLGHLDDGTAPVAPADVPLVRKALRKRRDRLADDVAAVLGSRAWRRRTRAIRAAALAGAWRSGPPAAVEARRFAAERLDLWWRALLALSEDLVELSPAPRHQVRIEAKKLRYVTEETAELFADVEEARAGFTAGLKAIQDALGELNDAQVARNLIADAGARAPALDPAEVRAATARAVAARARLLEAGEYWRPSRVP